MRLAAYLALGVSAASLGACGGGGGGGGGGSCTPTSTSASMSITGTGLSPKAVCALPPATVTFNNTDTVQHGIAFDASCAVTGGATTVSIDAGKSQAVGFPGVQTCTFHDRDAPGNAGFQGTVAVANAAVSGSGY
jgi:plastocyanin